MTLAAGALGERGARQRRPRPLRRALMLVAGSVVLGAGVSMLLTADLGSDGFSSLVNGAAMRTDTAFVVANTAISAAFLLVAALRGLLPGVGTLVQVVVV